MRLIDFIADVAETSARLQMRGGLGPVDASRLTASTLIRPDLVSYLQASIGPDITDPAERLCAMVLRMGEIIRGWARTCVFHQDFVSGRMRACEIPLRDYAVHHDLSPGSQNVDGRRRTPLREVASGGVGDVDYLSAFSHDPVAFGALASATVKSASLAGATALLIGPSEVVAPWRPEAGSTSLHTGHLLSLDGGGYDFIYHVRVDRRDLRL